MSCLEDFFDFYDFYDLNDFYDFNNLPFTVYRSPFTPGSFMFLLISCSTPGKVIDLRPLLAVRAYNYMID
ncbi:MAG: hypothetical protein JRC67_05525 [Deltaproteobacteria bacterium]|nr:hypothetical protein [Deltaproteobacteria bacterium]